MPTANQVSSDAGDVADSDGFRWLAAAGVIALGLVHVLVGWLALQVAWSGGAQADTSGAFATLAAQPLGRVLLWTVTVGLAALALWQLSEAAIGHRRAGDKRTKKRLKSAAKAVAYAVLALSAGRFAVGQGRSSSESQQSLTARVLSAPAGQLLVGAAGVAIIAVGAYLVRKGVTKKFVEDLDAKHLADRSSDVVIRLGQAGHLAKGVAYALVGGLVVLAAVRHNPEESGGLDSALQTLREQPYGAWLLTVVALGFVAYGLYCVAWARAVKND